MRSDTHDDMDLIRQQLMQTRVCGGAQIGLQPQIKAPAREKVAAKEKAIETDLKIIEKNKAAISAGYLALFEEIQKLSKDSMLTLEDLDEPLPLSAFEIRDEALALLADPSKWGRWYCSGWMLRTEFTRLLPHRKKTLR